MTKKSFIFFAICLLLISSTFQAKTIQAKANTASSQTKNPQKETKLPSYDSIRNSPLLWVQAVKQHLRPGRPKNEVKKMLGQPAFIERSKEYRNAKEHFRTDEVWRYENSSVQTLITWNAKDLLSSLELIYRLDQNSETTHYQMTSEGEILESKSPEPLISTVKLQQSWTFRSDLAYNFLVGRAGDTLLIKGDDGGFSGFHDDAALYGISAKDGAKRWKIDAGYGPLHYGITKDRSNAIVSTQPRDVMTLQSVQLVSGKKNWSRTFNTSKGEYNGYTIRANAADGVVALHLSKFDSGNSTDKSISMLVLDEKNGKQLWKQPLAEEEKMAMTPSPLPVILLYTQDTIKALHPKTGKLLWKMSGKYQADLMNDYIYSWSSDGRDLKASNGIATTWLYIGEEVMELNLSTGAVLKRMQLDLKHKIIHVQNDYFLIQESDEEIGAENKIKSTVLYNANTGTTVHTFDGNVSYGVLNGDMFYYLINGQPAAMSLSNKKQIWQSPLRSGAGQLILHQGKLYVPGISSMYILNAQDGSKLRRAANILFATPELRAKLAAYSYITAMDDGIYVGSGNGYFRKLSE